MKLLKCFKAPTLKQILLIGILKRLTAFKVVFYFIVFFFFLSCFMILLLPSEIDHLGQWQITFKTLITKKRRIKIALAEVDENSNICKVEIQAKYRMSI